MSDFTILEGNALDILRQMDDNCVHVCVTSPPYYGLRDYKSEPYVWPVVSYRPMPGLPEISFPCDPECEHEWVSGSVKKVSPKRDHGSDGGFGETRGTEKYRSDSEVISGGAACSRCGAWRGSLGQEPTPEMYVAHLVLICREIRRVLRKDGTFWLNLGDSSAANRGYQVADSKWKDVGNNKCSKVPDGLKPKDLVGVPWRVAFALQADDWWLRQDNIWHKPNVLPRSVTDNTTLDYEHMFMFARGRKYWFDQSAIRESARYAGKTVSLGNKSFARGQALGAGIEPSGNGNAEAYTVKETRNKRSVWAITTKASNWDFCKACSTLYVGKERRQIVREKYTDDQDKVRVRLYCLCGAHDQWESHFATFPTDLVEAPVKAGISPAGCCKKCGTPYRRVTQRTTEFGGGSGRAGRTPDEMNHLGKWADKQYGKNIKLGPVLTVETTGFEPACECNAGTDPCVVLDPFSGSGTTGIVALNEGARYIGIEVNPVYAEISRQRIAHETAKLSIF